MPKYVTQVYVRTVKVDSLLRSVSLAVSVPSLVSFGGAVANHLQIKQLNRFNNNGDSVVGPWSPLAPATRNIRASLGYGPSGPINRRVNELFAATTGKPDVRPIAGGVSVNGPDFSGMSLLTRKKYETAQLGTDVNPMIPGAVTPPRPIIGLGTEDMVEIMKMLQIHIMRSTVSNFALINR